MRAVEIPARWHEDLPIFAHPEFLRAVADDYGWLGGLDEHDDLRCILPYTVVRRGPLAMMRFRVETLPQGGELTLAQERAFLHGVTDHCRAIGAGHGDPGDPNTVFRTYPEGADAAPYGSYTVDLTLGEDELWGRVERITRQNIKTARNSGVTVTDGWHALPTVHALVTHTFKRSGLPFMSWQAYKRYMQGLGARQGAAGQCGRAHRKLRRIRLQPLLRLCGVCGQSGPAVARRQQAALLGGDAAVQADGGAAIRLVGARIRPEQASKHDCINALKRRLGATLSRATSGGIP